MSKPFDLLRELDRFGEGNDINLNDALIRPAFGLHVEQAIDLALKDPILLQGQRAEAMSLVWGSSNCSNLRMGEVCLRSRRCSLPISEWF